MAGGSRSKGNRSQSDESMRFVGEEVSEDKAGADTLDVFDEQDIPAEARGDTEALGSPTLKIDTRKIVSSAFDSNPENSDLGFDKHLFDDPEDNISFDPEIETAGGNKKLKADDLRDTLHHDSVVVEMDFNDEENDSAKNGDHVVRPRPVGKRVTGPQHYLHSERKSDGLYTGPMPLLEPLDLDRKSRKSFAQPTGPVLPVDRNALSDHVERGEPLRRRMTGPMLPLEYQESYGRQAGPITPIDTPGSSFEDDLPTSVHSASQKVPFEHPDSFREQKNTSLRSEKSDEDLELMISPSELRQRQNAARVATPTSNQNYLNRSVSAKKNATEQNKNTNVVLWVILVLVVLIGGGVYFSIYGNDNAKEKDETIVPVNRPKAREPMK